jgi:heptosyltransferase-1
VAVSANDGKPPLRVLLVKLSSMGDVIHNLPVVADILGEYPNALIDWVVEESYAALVRLNPGVRQVIPVALRRWRKAPFSEQTRREFKALRAMLKLQRYDIIIDTQALVKSALIARLARGVRHGWVAGSCREPLAAWFYNKTHPGMRFDAIPAVERYRDLVRQVLDTDPRSSPWYGLKPDPVRPPWGPPFKRLAVMITATARSEKLWHQDAWRSVAVTLAGNGYGLIFPWGTDEERRRAAVIANGVAGAVVAPAPFGLTEWAKILASANLVVGVDTGLTFMAAAVGTPVVGIFTATSPRHVGIDAATPHANMGDIGEPPPVSKVIEAALMLGRRP